MMDTPERSDIDGGLGLDGELRYRIDRRLVLLGLAAAPLVGFAGLAEAKEKKPKKPKKGKKPVLKSLNWDGTAKIYFGDKGVIDIGVTTMVEPFVRARSDSWLTSEGPTKRRTLFVEPAEAYSVRDGQRSPLPEQQGLHERQQFCVYGYMLGIGKELAKGPNTRRLQQPGYPVADLYYIGDRLAVIDMVVDPPRPGLKMAERFTFTGELTSGDVRWPQKIAILQDLRPSFELTITRFEATYA